MVADDNGRDWKLEVGGGRKMRRKRFRAEGAERRSKEDTETTRKNEVLKAPI
jgi:hypothetical protein